MTRKILRGLCAVAFACVLSVPGGGDTAWGATVTVLQARNVATSWILKDSNPMKNGMGTRLGMSLSTAEALRERGGVS